MIQIKRIYQTPAAKDGYRILVDRLWPRGLSKGKAKVDLWLRDIAPSGALRKWFSHEPKKWDDFREKYRKELIKQKGSLKEIGHLEKTQKKITLLFGSKDQKRNNAVVVLASLDSLTKL